MYTFPVNTTTISCQNSLCDLNTNNSYISQGVVTIFEFCNEMENISNNFCTKKTPAKIFYERSYEMITALWVAEDRTDYFDFWLTVWDSQKVNTI